MFKNLRMQILNVLVLMIFVGKNSSQFQKKKREEIVQFHRY